MDVQKKLYQDANEIIRLSICSVLPDDAVKRALFDVTFPGRVFVIAVGKAAWQMAKAASDFLDNQVSQGIVITKYGHVKNSLHGITCYEAGHPILDENTIFATEKALEMTTGLQSDDTVLFLLSGGGSALFEKPLIPLSELQDVTSQLLATGADIVEINTIRKRLSAVKGGRFAQHCAPAKIFAIILSDIIGDPLDMIASGPAYPDSSNCSQAIRIANKYHLELSDCARGLFAQETPKILENVTSRVTGNVRELCVAAAKACEELGYLPTIITTELTCEAKDAGKMLGALAKKHCADGENLAFIAGGETVVRLTGSGKGGRNQEVAISAAEEIAGIDNVVVFSVGSDGTDGPTDAAGGIVDGGTKSKLEKCGFSIEGILINNDAYPALEKTNGLIITGPTGTNVNDVAVVLIKHLQ